jgi:hypothetical protein
MSELKYVHVTVPSRHASCSLDRPIVLDVSIERFQDIEKIPESGRPPIVTVESNMRECQLYPFQFPLLGIYMSDTVPLSACDNLRAE